MLIGSTIATKKIVKYKRIEMIISNNKSQTSRPARVNKTVPKPPAVTHFWVEKPSNSINNEKAAIHTAE